ncbi:MAG: lytic transglycosylase domain-containing protein [Nitrospinaceae bacterium]|jgi:soluble lytic murein transglycosylase|nr:lytic transglycosylase domain-containing protein [Nitrospina sp.]MBT5375345.1 lytic transglycosylase domain-containing protein [Nitrospinaceae bacterium]MBT5869024.1 lytic transglycosylase domain-containing protein [Nitrospinaceae bacterium]MBT6347072.1 lytic transglycosylase domain-containing protein [Nitrospina sp.]
MTFFKTKQNIVPILFVLAFTGFFTGKTPQYVSGLSPFFSAVGQIEEEVFNKAKENRLQNERAYESQIREKIRLVIAGYKTGLDENRSVQIPEWILMESKKYGYDPLFLTALIITESSFNNWARSNRNAHGLMQLKPATAIALASETQLKWKGTPTLYDPRKNIALGAYYLNKLVSRFGDLTLALEAYNQGPTRLSRFLRKGHLPQRYSTKVLKNYRKIRFQPI